MHAVRKESSTTTRICAVFDSSMKTMSGVSLNDILMVGPTVHSPLINVLLRFRMHCIAIVADISKMYQATELPPSDSNLHRFCVESQPKRTSQRLQNDSGYVWCLFFIYCQYVRKTECGWLRSQVPYGFKSCWWIFLCGRLLNRHQFYGRENWVTSATESVLRSWFSTAQVDF